MAARLGSTTGEASDVPDILFLIRHLRLQSAQAVLDIVGQYYPANRIPVKTQYLVRRIVRGGEGMRPKTLSEVATLAAQGDSFDRCLANFLDEFYAAPSATALAASPLSSRRNSATLVVCRTPTSVPRRKNWRAVSTFPRPSGRHGGTRSAQAVVCHAAGRVARRAVAGKPARLRARNLFVSETPSRARDVKGARTERAESPKENSPGQVKRAPPWVNEQKDFKP